jgi:talin
MSINLKVTCGEQVKTMRLTSAMSVSEACAQLARKMGIDGVDHGLFQPGEGKRPARWLRADRTLGFYDLKNDDSLVYKKKHRPLKVLIVDGAQRTVIIDDSAVVADIVTTIGRKMALRNPEEYSLQRSSKDRAWLNPQKTLAEQAVSATDSVVLRKKWFVTDSEVSEDDPVQLHLIYSQGQTDIVAGHHYLKDEEACLFAALQCQVQFGNYNGSIHVPGFLKGKCAEFLPPTMHKKAGDHEKVAFREYRKLTGMTETKAKYRYVQLLRSLRTHGITVFECKLRPKSASSKPIPFKLGVSQHNITEIDAKTNAVIRETPLPHLRRWAAAPSAFTLDFGDFRDEHLTLITDDGDQISQLIAGYIDILLKKRNEAGQLVEEDDSQTATVESVGRIKGQAVRGQTAFTTGKAGMAQGRAGAVGGAQRGVLVNNAGFQPQQIRVESLADAQNGIKSLVQDSQEAGVPSQSTMTVVQWQQQLLQHSDTLGTQCAKLVADMEAGAPAGQLPDVGVLVASANELANNVGKLLAAAHSTSGAMGGDDAVLATARALANAVAALLKAADDVTRNPQSAQALQALRSAAEDLDNNRSALNAVARGNAVTDQDVALLLEAARAVASSVQGMLASAQTTGKADIIQTAQESLLEARGLMSAVRALGPVALDPDARRRLDKAAASVDEMAKRLAAAVAAGAVPASAADALLAQARDVSAAIAQLRAAADAAEKRPAAHAQKFAAAAARLIEATEGVKKNVGTPKALVGSVKELAQASGATVVAAKHMAKNAGDEATRARMLEAARAVADATRRLVDDAKVASQRPADHNAKQAVVGSANALKGAVESLVGDAGRTQSLAALRAASKEAAAATLAMNNVARSGKADTGTAATDQALRGATRTAQQSIDHLLRATAAAARHPEDASAQSALAEKARETVPRIVESVQAAKVSGPNVRDPTGKKDLLLSAKRAADAVKKLLEASRDAAAVSGSAAIDAAIEELSTEDALLDSAQFDAQGGNLFRPAGKTKSAALGQLNKAAERFTSVNKSLPQAAAKPATLSKAAQQAGAQATAIAQASRDIAGFCEPATATELLKAAKAFNSSTVAALEGAKAAVRAPPKDAMAAKQMAMFIGAKTRGVAEALDTLVQLATESEPGAKECDAAIAAIAARSAQLAEPTSVNPNADFKAASQDLRSAAQGLTGASTQVKDAATNDKSRLAVRADALAKAHDLIVQQAAAAAAAAPDKQTQHHIVERATALGEALGAQLRSAKLASADDVASQAGLLDASRAVAAAIADLLKLADTTSPGAREFATASEAVRGIMESLNRPSEAPASATPLNDVDGALRTLNKAADDLAGATKAGGAAAHTTMVPAAKAAVVALTAVAAAAKGHAGHGGGPGAPPGGALSPRSAMSAASAVDITDPAGRATNAAESLADAAAGGAARRGEVVAATKTSAVAGGELVAAAKQVASYADPTSKRNILAAAQALASAIQKMVGSTKEYARNPTSEAAQQSAIASAQQFGHAVDSLVAAMPEASGGTLRGAGNLNASRAAAGAAGPGKSKSAAELLAAARTLAFNVSQLLSATEPALETHGPSALAPDEVASAAADVRQATAGVATKVKDARPGFAELAQAIQRVDGGISELDAAVIDADVGILEPAEGKTLTDCHSAIAHATTKLSPAIRALGGATLDPAAMKGAAGAIGTIFGSLVDGSRDAASLHTEPTTQLDPAIVAANATLRLLRAVRADAPAAERSSLATSAAASVDNLVASMKGGGGAAAVIDSAVEQVAAASKTLAGAPTAAVSIPYADATQALATAARQVQGVCSALYMGGSADPKALPRLAAPVGSAAPSFASTVVAVVAHVSDPSKKAELARAAANVMKGMSTELTTGKAFFADPTVSASRSAFTVAAGALPKALKALQEVLDSTDAGASGIRTASTAIGRHVAQLDEVALFAAAGQFDYDAAAAAADAPSDFAAGQQKLASQSKAVAAAGGDFVKAISAGPTAVASSAAAAETQVAKVASAAIATAGLMGDASGQANLLGAAKDLSLAMQSLMQAGKLAYSNPSADRARANVDAALKSLSLTADSVADIVSSAEADSSETGSEIDKARARLVRAVADFGNASLVPMRNAVPRAIVASALTMAQGASALVTATNASADDLLAALAASVKASLSLLAAGKGGAATAPTPDAAEQLATAAKGVVEKMISLLQAVKVQSRRASTAGAASLSAAQDAVVDAIGQFVEAVKAWPNSADAVRLYFSGENLEKLAADALEKCRAAAISSGQQVVATMPAGYSPGASATALEKEDIKEAFVDATAGAVSSVVAAVACCERALKEIAAKAAESAGGKSAFLRDPTWARTIMTEADDLSKAVEGMATQVLRAIQGTMILEELEASAQGVASAASKLVGVTRVKTDAASEAASALANSGRNVAKAAAIVIAVGKEFEDQLANPNAFDNTIDESEDAIRKQVEILELRKKIQKLQTRLA